MRELRRHIHPSVAAGRHRPLPVQRMRTVPQDEWPEPTTHQAQEKTSEFSTFSFHPKALLQELATQICARSRCRQHNSRKVIFSL